MNAPLAHFKSLTGYWLIGAIIALIAGFIVLSSAFYSINEWSDGSSIYESWADCPSDYCTMVGTLAKVDSGKIGIAYSLFGISALLTNFLIFGRFLIMTSESIIAGLRPTE